MRFLLEAMIFFGLISTMFDLLTMQALYMLLQPQYDPSSELFQRIFRTGWFLESAFSEMFVTFSIRTHLSFYRSKPSGWLVGTTEIIFLVTVFMIYSPVGGAFQFVMPPDYLLVMVAVILISYFVLLELVKKPFFKRHLFGRPSLEELNEIRKLRGKRGAIMRKLKKLQRLRESGEIAEDAYLTFSSELEEELMRINEKIKELLKS